MNYLRALKPKGKYVTVGGAISRLLEALLLYPWISFRGKKKIQIVALKPNKDLGYINKLFEEGKLMPVIDGPYSLAEVPKAMEYFGKGEHKGKVVISVSK